MKKLRFYIYIFSIAALGLHACSDDSEVVADPPKAQVSADKSGGSLAAEKGEIKIILTVKEVKADNIAFFPFGVEGAPVYLEPKNFSNGEYRTDPLTGNNFTSYKKKGVYNVVVITNNRSLDGKTVKTVTSDPVVITITD